MANFILESFISREPAVMLSERKLQNWHAMLRDLLQSEYTAMLFYLQVSYAIPREMYYFDYYGQKNKDIHYQLRCHGIHDMRHAEMLGRTIVRLDGLPTLEIKPLPTVGTYRELLDVARRLEENKLELYKAYLEQFTDKEIYLLFSNTMRENELHAALDEQLLKMLEAEGLADEPIPDTVGQGWAENDVNMLQRVFYLGAYSILHLIYLSMCLGTDQSLAPRLRGLAIEHMKHLDRVASQIQNLGARPQFPLSISFIQSEQFSADALLEKNVEIMEQKAEEMGNLLQHFSSENARSMCAAIIPKELENASDLRSYLGSLSNVRTVH